MKVVGLTGGIASGKSTVADMLRARGAAVIDADVVAREIVAPGEDAYNEIVAAWGPAILGPDGALDRARLGAIIFGDAEARARLNAMTHPRVRARMLDQAEALRNGPSPPSVAVLDIPLLFENGLEALVEETWLVYLDPAHQRERLMRRNGYSREEAEQRIAAQLPLSEKARRATRLIDNNGDLSQLEAEVARVWREAGLA
jgi:dephospho-CoA kinase